jgi:hypothetical protein
MTASFTIRIRRADREVELQGTEEFVRELAGELLDQYLGPPVAGELQAKERLPKTVPPVEGVRGRPRGFRELLAAAGDVTAAERCVLAAYTLYSQGTSTFDKDSVLQLFDESFERQPNFWREIPKAARQGWVMKAPGEPRTFKLTNAGIARVRELVGQVEDV